MKDRSNEIIKQLNRLANDRSLTPIARNKLHAAVQHIREMQHHLQQREVSVSAALDPDIDDPEAGSDAGQSARYRPLESLLPQTRKLLRALHG